MQRESLGTPHSPLGRVGGAATEGTALQGAAADTLHFPLQCPPSCCPLTSSTLRLSREGLKRALSISQMGRLADLNRTEVITEKIRGRQLGRELHLVGGSVGGFCCCFFLLDDELLQGRG